MNSLSWIIYAAQAADGFKFFLEFVTFIPAFMVMVWYAVAALAKAGGDRDVFFPHEVIKAKYAAVYLAVAFLAAAVPSRDTIYRIAASELGEKAAQTEVARDVLEIVKKELKRMKEAK